MMADIKTIRKYACLTALTLALMTGCAQRPEVLPEPEAERSVASRSPSGFLMKSYHRSMKEEMRKSYDRANEILIGIFSGIHQDKKGNLVYYFSDFSLFDKDMLAWGSSQNVIMKVQPDVFEPEIIRRNEFKNLLDLDKTGICWDFYEGDRNVFLIEGKMNLIFCELGFDEVSGDSFRILLDSYPSTDECRARDVFNMMIQEIIQKHP
jgi:hypothetical protein